MAAIVAEYAYQFLVRRELVQMTTLSPAVTHSLSLTEANVAACFGERVEP